MIYIHRHVHRWVATGERQHDCPVYACSICGDRGFETDEYQPSASSTGSEQP